MSDHFEETERDILITLRADARSTKDAVQKLHDSVVKQWEKIDDHSLDMAKIKNNVETMDKRQRDHEDGHRWWAGTVIAIAGVVTGAIEFVTGRAHHQ
jgi:hypothetical protein